MKGQTTKSLYPSAIGIFEICFDEEAVKSIRIIKGRLENEPASYNKTKPANLGELAYRELLEYLSGKRKMFTFPITLDGTDFQRLVWEALLEIPYGQKRTYKEIAESIGRPKAARAVGKACNKNPLLIVVPCHRVVGSGGSLIGYAYGLEMKVQLLQLEQSRQNYKFKKR